MTLDSVKSYTGALYKMYNQTGAAGDQSSSFFPIHPYLFVRSEILNRVPSHQPYQPTDQGDSDPSYYCAHVLLHNAESAVSH